MPISTLRILLVDDEPGVRKYIKQILSRQGCSVVEAEDGLDACRVIQEDTGKFDLLVTDVRMPGMDGLSLAAHMRERFPNVGVLYVSGYIADAAVTPKPLLKKPFPPAALIEQIQELAAK